DAVVGAQPHDGVVRGLDDGGQTARVVAGRPELGDVDERHYHAEDHALIGQVRLNSLEVPDIGVRPVDLAVRGRPRAQHLPRVGHEIAAGEGGDDVGDRAADVGLDEAEELLRVRREALDSQVV